MKRLGIVFVIAALILGVFALVSTNSTTSFRPVPPVVSAPRSSVPSPVKAVPRALLSVPTNRLVASGISPQVCNTNNLILYQGAVYDSTFTRNDPTVTNDCGSIKFPLSGAGPCPITGSDLTGTQTGLTTSYTDGLSIGECPYQTGPAFQSPLIPISPSTNYTISGYYYSNPNVSYVGDIYFSVDSYTSSGTLIAPGGQTTSVDSVANSRTGVWEETLEWFTTPSNAAYVKFSPNRYVPSTGPVSDMWLDDIALYDGWVHREDTPVITKNFAGTTTAIDPLGNITVKRINGPTAGQMEPFFPACISPGGPSTHTFQWYANMGWNCIWSSNMLNYQTSSTWGSTNPLVMARAAVSSAVPDGMRVMMDVNEAVRGHFSYNGSGQTVHNWYSTIKDELVSAMTNITSHGLSDSLLGFINDAENKTSRRQRDRAVMALVDSTDRANNGGNRRWPIITNAGNPSIGRSYTKADGTPYTDMTGTYMVRTGPFEKMKYEQGMNVPAGYCQVQSGGYNYRSILYRCIAEGGKMFNLWSDGNNTNLALGGSVGANIEYEPSFPDFPYMFAEMNKLLPLIRQPLATSWSVTSSNPSVKVWPRAYNGVPYVILSNVSGISQSTTLSFNGVTGSITSLIDYGWSTGNPAGGTVAKNSGGATTVIVPGSGNASAVGVGGGTMVLRAAGGTVDFSGVTTTTTVPGSTTTTIPSSSDDWIYKNSQPVPAATISLGSTYAVETGVRVNVSCNGKLPGVWWYRTADDTGSVTVDVWSITGISLGSRTMTVADGPGWRYIPFIKAVPVSSGNQYIIGVHHPNGAYGYALNGFTGRSLTSPGGCLTIPSSSNNNSLYAYANVPTYPTLSYSDSEYFISPTFAASVATTTTTSAPVSTTTLAPTTTTTIPVTPYDDTSFDYSGSWAFYGPTTGGISADYNTTLHESSTTGAAATFTFNGTKASIYGVKGPAWGAMNITVDGVSVGSPIDTWSSVEGRRQKLYEINKPSGGNHTVVVTVAGVKNPASSGYYVALDYVDVSGGAGVVTTTTTTSTTSTTTTSTSTTTTTAAPATTTTVVGTRNITIDSYVDTNSNGVFNAGEPRLARTQWRILNGSGSVIAGGTITTSAATYALPTGSGYTVRFYLPLRATSSTTVSIPSSGAFTARAGGCCTIIVVK